MKKVLSILICGFLFWGCTDDTVGPIPTGNIAGTVKLNNTPGNDFSGVSISLDGTSYSATSKSDGKWELSNVPAGIYKIVFSKSGYFTLKHYNFQFVGNGTYYYYQRTLAKVPSETVTQLNAQVIDSLESIFLYGTLSAAVQSQQSVIVFVSKSPLTNSIPIEAFDVRTFGASIGQSEFSLYYYPGYNPNIITISKGDTLYAIAYVGDIPYTGLYTNPITGLYEFDTPGVSLSNVVSFVVP
jgi:hypothetical protein